MRIDQSFDSTHGREVVVEEEPRDLLESRFDQNQRAFVIVEAIRSQIFIIGNS
jgi:hypothetical protein